MYHNNSQLTVDQQKVFNAALHGPKNFLVVHGAAGTGKSYLAAMLGREFARTTQFKRGTVHYLASTNKAALVLRKNGAKNVSTLHSSLMCLVTTKNGQQIQKLKDSILSLAREEKTWPAKDPRRLELTEMREALQELIDEDRPIFSAGENEITEDDLTIVDEISMVGKKVGEILRHLPGRVVCFGDPFQLPAIPEPGDNSKDAGYFANIKPDYVLNTIMRQAAGNPIITLATKIRRNDEYAKMPDRMPALKIQDKDFTLSQMADFDQVVIWRKVDAEEYCAKMRQARGYAPNTLHVGEILISTKTGPIVYEGIPQENVVNGEQFDVLEIKKIHTIRPCVFSVDHEVKDATGNPKHYKVYTVTLRSRLKPKMEAIPFTAEIVCDHLNSFVQATDEPFKYGYALTANRAQGSEWPHLGVVWYPEKLIAINEFRLEPGKPPKRIRSPAEAERMMRRWYYTAVTRAKSRLCVYAA